MNFVADENVDRPIVDVIRADGHSVLAVAEMAPGISDDTVLQLANDNGAMLLTADKDFGELIFRQKRLMAGIILIRLAGLSPDEKALVVSLAIKAHVEDLPGSFTVISRRTMRIRRQ